MVYHLKQLHIKYRAEKAIYGASYRNVNVVEYVNEMDHANLFYTLKQYYNVVVTTFS
jgi:hypothetical protein